MVVSWSTVYYEPRPNSTEDLWRMRLFCRFDTITKVYADGGYTGPLIGWAKEMFGYALEIVKRNDHCFCRGVSQFVVFAETA